MHLRAIFRFFAHLGWIAFLTLLTQIGGFIWLLALLAAFFLRRQWPLRGLTWVVFILLYLAATLFLVPPLARLNGRVPMPVFSNPQLRPESLWFCLLNRHYVRPDLRATLEKVAQDMQKQFPGAAIWYLDANFPFINGYPLEPHFSHSDGKKIDLSFYWTHAVSGAPVNANPSPFGYGLYAGPLPNERDYAAGCKQKGYWYIDLDGRITAPFISGKNYRFDAARTRELLRLLAEHPAIRRILVQPHLKQRLGLSAFGKLRFQGCKAARHDDHAHVELR
ncbi:MAG: hypothetical protein R3D58_18095 [Saprospiraceae bacterium]|nr:hypothetical protein [Lewinellaceae bacterium]